MTRISTGKYTNHLTGEVADLQKEKPALKPGESRCFATLEVIDAATGQVTETYENVENVKKAVSDQLVALSAPSYTHLWGGSAHGVNTSRMYEIHLLDDEAELESQKYVANEGTVVGYARLDSDYGGSDPMRGSRNKSLSNYHVDATTGNIVCEISFIWDETRVNGARINKVALSPITSGTHVFADSSKSYIHEEDMAVFTGSSHRFLHGQSDGRGWTLQIEEQLLTKHWWDQYNRCSHLPSHMLAFGSMMMAPGRIWEDKEFELYTLDISLRPEDVQCYRSGDIRKVTLPGVNDLWRRGAQEWDYFFSRDPSDQTLGDYPFTYQSESMSRDTWNYHYYRSPTNDRTLDRIHFVAIIDNVMTVKTYRPLYDELERIQTLPEVINTKTYTLDDAVISVRSRIAVSFRDGDLEVFYPTDEGQVCVTVNATDDTLSYKTLSRRVDMHGAVHVRDNIYMFANARGGVSDLLGGYIDFDTNGYIETFRYYPVDDSYYHFNAIWPMKPSTDANAHPIFDVRTGRIYDIRDGDENYSTRIAIPVDYVAPSRYMHVDTFPERIKKSTEQLRFTYRIEYTPNTAALQLPFDHIHGAEANANLRLPMSHSSDRNLARAERQEYRHLQDAVSHVRRCPTLNGKTIYVDRAFDFWVYLLERDDGSFYFRIKYHPSPEHGWVEEEHDIEGWNREIFDDTSDWRNQYLNIGSSTYHDSSYRENYAPFSREDGLVARRRIYDNVSYIRTNGSLRFHTPDHGEAVDWLYINLIAEHQGFTLDEIGLVGPTELLDVSDATAPAYAKRSSWYYSNYQDGAGDQGGILTIEFEDESRADYDVVIDLSAWSWDKTKYDVGIVIIGGNGYNPGNYASSSKDTDVGQFYQNGSVGTTATYAIGLCHKGDHDNLVIIEETRELHRFCEMTIKTS